MIVTTTQKGPETRTAWKVSIPLTFSDLLKIGANLNFIILFVDIGEKEDTGKPVIRLFGVNANGNSVCAHVHNFTAYFYAHVIEKNVTLTAEEIEQFRIQLNQSMHERDAVLEIEIVEKYPIMNYQAEK